MCYVLVCNKALKFPIGPEKYKLEKSIRSQCGGIASLLCRHPYGCQFKSQLPHFQYRSLFMAWEHGRGQLKALGPSIHVKTLKKHLAPSFESAQL